MVVQCNTAWTRILLKVRGPPMLLPHYAHWLKDRCVKVGGWWSAAALVHVLATSSFDHAYNSCVFQLIKSIKKIWDESAASSWEIKHAKSDWIEFDMMSLPSSNDINESGIVCWQKGWLAVDNLPILLLCKCLNITLIAGLHRISTCLFSSQWA